MGAPTRSLFYRCACAVQTQGGPQPARHPAASPEGYDRTGKGIHLPDFLNERLITGRKGFSGPKTYGVEIQYKNTGSSSVVLIVLPLVVSPTENGEAFRRVASVDHSGYSASGTTICIQINPVK